MRLGVVTDLHVAPPGEPPAFWQGPVHFDQALPRLERALDWFAQDGVDRVVVLGDLTNNADAESLAKVRDALGEAQVVTGNHDLSPDHLRAAGFDVVGVPIISDDGGVTAHVAGPVTPAPLMFSHGPVLDIPDLVTAAGWLHLGNIGGLDPVRDAIDEPTVVLSGHLHVRAARAHGPILQLVFGPIVEAPADAAIVEIDDHEVERTCRSFAPGGPVLAADRERWRYADGVWKRA